jgi:dipeptidyl aminopeptidase/acylaminoacyl peptidase
MHAILVALALTLLSQSTFAATIVERKVFTVPEYHTLKGIERYATRDEYDAARTDRRFQLEKLTYESGGLRVHAYLYAPAKAGAPLPAVVYNRGSFTRTEFADELLTTFHRLAKAGFIVIAPMYRGSGGAEGRDEMGGADLEDLMNVRAVVGEIPSIDSRNLFLYGESRGGMMVFQASRDRFSARAAAVFGAFTDLESFFREQPRAAEMAPKIWPGYEKDGAAIRERRSAIRWAEKLDVPLLILHGGRDESVSPTHALALASRLQVLGKPYELVIRSGANHVLTEWREERDRHAVEWFRKHIQK